MDNNPEYVKVDGQKMRLRELLDEYRALAEENERLKKQESKAIKRYRRAMEFEPYEAEHHHDAGTFGKARSAHDHRFKFS